MGSRLEAGSNATRKRIENHSFDDEEGEEYGASSFGGFGDYFRRKKLKLQNRDADIRSSSSSSNNPPIFRGVVAHVNGYTQPSLNDLHRLIVSHGGGFLQYLDGKTAATHIIASSLTPRKREEFRRYRIVKPAWVVDSVKAGRLLTWSEYRVVDEGPGQRVLGLGGDGRVLSQSLRRETGYRDQTASSWYTSQLCREGTRDETGAKGTSATTDTVGAKDGSFSELGLDDFDTIMDDIEDETRPLQSRERSSDIPPSVPATERQSPYNLGEERQLDAAPEPKDKTPTNFQSDDFDKVTSDNQDGIEHQTDSPKPSSNAKPTSDTNMTPEEYNAQLLANPQMRNSSVVNPDFIQQFYRESRLHHLSTWKAELRAQLQSAARQRASSRPAKKRAPGARRYILHVDFDSFFAAVSIKQQQQTEPGLEDKPVAVAHGTGPGSEIASCNYPARAFGIRNGMWMKGALEKCPELKVLPYDFPAYEDASKKFYEAILDTEGVVQSVSIDEALVDVTSRCLEAGGSDGRGVSEGSIYREQDMADSIAQRLRDSIKEKTGCNVSVGIGGNVLLAKLALRKAKPAGQFQLKPETVLGYIGGLTVQELPGVAYSLGAKLEELGVKFVKDIRELTKERLITHLGPKTGAKLWDYARGVDNTEVGDQGIRKSVSAEINWGIRFVTQAQADEFVQNLCDELHRRLLENAVKGKQLTMRIMRRAADAPLEPPKHLGHGKCDTFNRSVALGVATNASDVIGREAVSILRSFKFSPGDLRGIGVQMTKLEPIKQGSSGELESSQRQLQFKPSTPSTKRVQKIDPDEIDSPQKGDASQRVNLAPRLNDASQKPLNITGTQFIMPSQVDPSVLAELPQDIRSQLIAKPKQQTIESSGIFSPGRSTTPRTESPSSFVPPQSQLDPETLEALPEDVRAEVLAYYNQQQTRNPTPQPAPQSPRRNPPPPPPRPRTTPTKSRTTRKRARPTSKPSAPSKLVQSNFVFPSASTTTSSSMSTSTTTQPSTTTTTTDIDEIPADFLAALPDDIRQEVLAEHRRTRLQKRSGLSIPQAARRKLASSSTTSSRAPPRPRTLVLPPRPEKPTFTARKLSGVEEVRGAVGEWVEAFKGDGEGEGGPFVEDVKLLAGYLGRVVREERDVAKAVDVVRWLGWLVGEEVGSESANMQGREQDKGKGEQDEDERVSWNEALRMVRAEVGAAVEERGLPPVDFT